MSRTAKAGCISAAFLLVVAGLAVFAGPDDSPSKHAPDDSTFPKQCAGFLTSERTRLTRVWGDYERHPKIVSTAYSGDRRLALLVTVPENADENSGSSDDATEADSILTLRSDE